jgi:hypothetical protein
MLHESAHQTKLECSNHEQERVQTIPKKELSYLVILHKDTNLLFVLRVSIPVLVSHNGTFPDLGTIQILCPAGELNKKGR